MSTLEVVAPERVIDEVCVRRLVYVNEANEVVLRIGLGGNNDKEPQRQGRLQHNWQGDYPAEREYEPGPDCLVGWKRPKDGGRGNSIISQDLQWGPRTLDGTHRCRLTSGIYADGEGGLSAVIDSTTNDPSLSEGQSYSIPLVLNAGEGRGIYLVIHPATKEIELQEGVVRPDGKVDRLSSGRIPTSTLRAILWLLGDRVVAGRVLALLRGDTP
jgi:hypothetical protein